MGQQPLPCTPSQPDAPPLNMHVQVWTLLYEHVHPIASQVASH